MGVRFLPGLPFLGTSWTPWALGSDLLAWWDAERPDLITESGGAVSSWRDIVGGYDAGQATGALQPTWSATSFGGRPATSFDGVDDYLTAAIPATFPLTNVPSEIWALVDQQALPDDIGTRTAACYGGTNTSMRSVDRTVVSGVNRCRSSIGNGTTQTAVNPNIDFSGRHIARNPYDGITAVSEIDGNRFSGIAVTATTAASRVRIGAGCNSSASLFWKGTISALLFTGPLTAGEAVSLYAWLNGRL